jgi:hypothetical protein
VFAYVVRKNASYFSGSCFSLSQTNKNAGPPSPMAGQKTGERPWPNLTHPACIADDSSREWS